VQNIENEAMINIDTIEETDDHKEKVPVLSKDIDEVQNIPKVDKELTDKEELQASLKKLSINKIMEKVQSKLEWKLARDKKLQRKPTEKVLDQIIAKIGKVNVQLENKLCLADKEWLNDEVIDAFNVLVAEYQRTKTKYSNENHLFPALFLSQFEKFGHIRVRRYHGFGLRLQGNGCI
jgi:Ulp1 family protease